MCLEGLNEDLGYVLNREEGLVFSNLFFADDGIIASESALGLQTLVTYVSDRMAKVGLNLNAGKSNIMCIRYDNACKKHYLATNTDRFPRLLLRSE